MSGFIARVTLPGNVTLAINPDITYVTVKHGRANYIVARDRELAIFKKDYTIVDEYKGDVLIGKSYKPLFDYYSSDTTLANHQRGWKIYGADFVTTTDGTGIVHIAPAFGEDDLALGQKENLPFVQHVGIDGTFKKEVKDFAGQKVKPKEHTGETDEAIVGYLEKKESLFAVEPFTHAYPHCWRCDTPLLNYAASSWFVRVTSIKDKLLEEHGKVKWMPHEIGEGRFGKWLEGARDWAISRSRYWGATIPVWTCRSCGAIDIVGSIEELSKKVGTRNTYLVMRHAVAENNTKVIVSGDPRSEHHLTEKGRAQAGSAGAALQSKKIDFIISSDFLRTRETAEGVAGQLGLPLHAIIYDDRLREPNYGAFNGKPNAEY